MSQLGFKFQLFSNNQRVVQEQPAKLI